MTRSFQVNLNPAVTEIVPALAFYARSCTVQNSTGQWWEIGGTPIPPYQGGVVVELNPSQAPRIVARTPPGFTSAPVAGEIGSVIFSDVDLSPSPGVALTAGSAAAHVVATGSAGAAGSPVSVAVPAIAMTGDVLIAITVAHDTAGNIPGITTPPGFTNRASLGFLNGAATRGLRLNIDTAAFSGQVSASAAFVNASDGASMVLLVVRGAAGIFSAATTNQVNAAGTVVVSTAPANSGLAIFAFATQGTIAIGETYASAGSTVEAQVIDMSLLGRDFESVVSQSGVPGTVTATYNGNFQMAGTAAIGVS